MKKKGFVFYASYYEAIQTLSVKNKLLAYEAITRYALYQDVMPNLPSRVLAILMVAMPIIKRLLKLKRVCQNLMKLLIKR